MIDFKTFKASVIEEFSSDCAEEIIEDPKILDKVKSASNVEELFQAIDDVIAFEHDDIVSIFSYGIYS